MSVGKLTVLPCIDATDDGCDAVSILSCYNKLVIYTGSVCWAEQLFYQTISSSAATYCIVFI
jgi:hypothetical protein